MVLIEFCEILIFFFLCECMCFFGDVVVEMRWNLCVFLCIEVILFFIC